MDSRDLRSSIAIRCPGCGNIITFYGEKRQANTKIGHIHGECQGCGLKDDRSVITGRKWLTICELRKAVFVVASKFRTKNKITAENETKVKLKDDTNPSGIRYLTIY